MSRFWRNLKYKLSWGHIKYVILDIPNRIRDVYLCWKYPFLRLRNAFSGLEHNWWPAREYHRNNWSKCVRSVFVEFENDENRTYDTELTKGVVRATCILNLDSGLRIEATNEYVYVIYNNHIMYTYDLRDYFKVLPCAVHIERKAETDSTDNLILKYKGGEALSFTEYGKNVSRFCSVVTNRWLHAKIQILDWIEKYPYQWIHFLPKYSWYGAIPYGWRKCFGMQLVKEIATALKDVGGRKAMKNMQITDIKEKWGSLQIYTSGCPDDVHKIIEKYEYISFRTCMNCGRPAYGVTSGWVKPLCEECFKNSDLSRIRPFYHKDNSWYGYTSSNAKEEVFRVDLEIPDEYIDNLINNN